MSPTPEELKPPIEPEIHEAAVLIKAVLDGLQAQNGATLVGIVADRSQKGLKELCVHPLIEIDETEKGDNYHKYKTYVFAGNDLADNYLASKEHGVSPKELIVNFGEWVGGATYKVFPLLQLSELTPGDRVAVIFSDTDFSLERNLTVTVLPADYRLLMEGLKRAAGKIK